MKKTFLGRLSFYIYAAFVSIVVASPAYAICENVEPDVTCKHGISMFGDLKYPADYKHFDYVNSNAPKGGEIKYAASGSSGTMGTFDSLNAFILKGVPADGLGLIYDTLTQASADEPTSEYGLLAESIEIPKDKSWVAFNLRKEAKWNDGKPITADDVVFSFDIMMKEGNPAFRIYYADVEKAEKVSDHKIKFLFKNSQNRELPLILGQLQVIPKHYYETHKFSETTLEPPLGSGQYKIDSFSPGKWIKYSRVNDYWGKDLPINVGQNNFDTITYIYYRDMTVAVEAFKAGEYDLRQENVARIWATAYNIPQVSEGRIVKKEVPHENPTGMQGFVFNTRKAKFSDPLVRKALTYTFDFEWTNKNIFNGAYSRTSSYFSNSEYAHNHVKDGSGKPEGKELALLEPFRDQLPKEVFESYYVPPTTDGSGNIRENLKMAKTLLEQADWKVKNGVLVNEKTNEPMEIEFLLNSPSFERVVAPVVQNMGRLGIKASIRTVDDAQYVKRNEEFDFDIVVNVYGQSHSPGNEQFGYWHSAQADVRGSNNLAGIKNPVVDALVDKLVKAETKEDLVAATRALDRVLLYNYYVIPNWHVRSFRVVYWNKFTQPHIAPKYALGLNTWWYDKEKAEKLNKPN